MCYLQPVNCTSQIPPSGKLLKRDSRRPALIPRLRQLRLHPLRICSLPRAYLSERLVQDLVHLLLKCIESARRCFSRWKERLRRPRPGASFDELEGDVGTVYEVRNVARLVTPKGPSNPERIGLFLKTWRREERRGYVHRNTLADSIHRAAHTTMCDKPSKSLKKIRRGNLSTQK